MTYSFIEMVSLGRLQGRSGFLLVWDCLVDQCCWRNSQPHQLLDFLGVVLGSRLGHHYLAAFRAVAAVLRLGSHLYCRVRDSRLWFHFDSCSESLRQKGFESGYEKGK